MLAPTISQLLADPITHYPAATVACFDPTTGELPRRRLDPERTIAFIERLAAAGAPALLIAASTGQGHLRTIAELDEWYRVAAKASRSTTLLTGLLRPEDGSAANQQFASLLADLGYSVAFVRPGRDLAATASPDEVVDNMLPAVRAAAAAGLAVGLYSIPDVSGLPMSAAVASRLVAGAGGDRIVAIKVTEADYDQSTLRFLAEPRLAHLKIVQGWDPHVERALREGPAHDRGGRQRCGITSGPMSFAIHQYTHLLAAAEQDDWAEVAAAQNAVNLLFAAMQDDPGRFADLQRAKHIMGLGHPLTGEVTRPQVDRVLAALAAVPRAADRDRLARSLNLLEESPYRDQLRAHGSTA